MKRLKLSETQIIAIQGEADAGLSVKEISRKHRISERPTTTGKLSTVL